MKVVFYVAELLKKKKKKDLNGFEAFVWPRQNLFSNRPTCLEVKPVSTTIIWTGY